MVLQTERLVMRHWEEADAANLFKYASDPEVGPAAGWPAHTSIEDSLVAILGALSGPETYAICLKEDGMPIGSIGLHFAPHTDMAVRDDECELGYWIGRPFWGRGIVPEAVREMLRHAFEDLGLSCVWAGYYDGNDKSRRVQEKCGFRYQWTTDKVDVPLLHEVRKGHVSRITREEWLADLAASHNEKASC